MSMFSIGNLKAHGPDGFPAKFYHDNWSICSSNIYSTVKDCFTTACLHDNLNNTLIALVLKVTNATVMSQFRPISLCNTLYKVILKKLVNKLKPIMSKIVSLTQVNYVPGRQIVDNIIIAQEVLHKFRTSKSKNGFIAWKIDLSKAYDNLQWHFLKDVLWEASIRGKVLELLMQCITTVKYQAILNGERTGSV